MLVKLISTVAVGLLASSTASGTRSGNALPDMSPEGLESCSFKGVAGVAHCGSILVPERVDRPKGRQIPIRVVVLRTLGDAVEPDPLFTFAGGPGQAGTTDVPWNAERFATIRQKRDVVMIDQRGTGGSNPLPCGLGAPDAAIAALMTGKLSQALVRTCREKLQQLADLAYYTTDAAAADVEEVRKRLGYKSINIYGGSYGSRAALVYLNRYPDRVRTATLRAVFPLDLRNPLYSSRDAARSFNLLASDCASAVECRSAFGDIRATFDSVRERLAARPAQLTFKSPEGVGTVSITEDIFAGLLRRMLYSTDGQRAVPLMLQRAAHGDFSMLERAVRGALAIQDDLAMGMFLSVTCAEDVRYIRPADLKAMEGADLFGSSFARNLFAACQLWPKGKPPRRPKKPPGAPTLLISGTADPMTPPEYAHRVAGTLQNTRLVEMKGEAHGPFPECAIQLMTRFIEIGILPATDPDCIRQMQRGKFITN